MKQVTLERMEADIAAWSGKNVCVKIPLSKTSFIRISGELSMETNTETGDPVFHVWGWGSGVDFDVKNDLDYISTGTTVKGNKILLINLKNHLTA